MSSFGDRIHRDLSGRIDRNVEEERVRDWRAEHESLDLIWALPGLRPESSTACMPVLSIQTDEGSDAGGKAIFSIKAGEDHLEYVTMSQLDELQCGDIQGSTKRPLLLACLGSRWVQLQQSSRICCQP